MLRLNIGCGEYPLRGADWWNIDADPAVQPDQVASVPPIPAADASVAEIYAGHLLEHLTPADAAIFLGECYRVLIPGGRLGIVVPDTAEIYRRYLAGAVDEIEFPAGTWWPIRDLDSVNHLFAYSDAQASPHRWQWDVQTLARALQGAGFTRLTRINRFSDPRLGTPAWYQDGLDGWKAEA
jgi:predicted SAM-dependent methyltransferase